MSKSNHSNPDKRKIVKKKNRLIFLIGFMASGKTYLGTRVSAALGIPFADMDEEIIAQKKKSINQIFEEEGEEGFRKIERKVLESFIQSADNRNTPLIISTGGRSEEHTSELQSRGHLVCRLLLEKKKNSNNAQLV